MEEIETVDFTVWELREIVEKASRENPHLTSRLEKAAFLVLLRPIEPLGDHHFQVDRKMDYVTTTSETATANVTIT